MGGECAEHKQLLLFGETSRPRVVDGIISAGERSLCKCHGTSVGALLRLCERNHSGLGPGGAGWVIMF